MGSRTCRSIMSSGVTGILVDIECHISNSLPTIIIIGLASKAVNEARDRLRGAFTSSGLKLPRKRITINLAPADLQKTDSSLDLAMATAIFAVSQPVARLTDKQAVIGEVGLDGRIRPVRGIIGKLLAGKQHGLDEFFIPADNLDQARLVPDVTLFPVSKLSQLYAHLLGSRYITPVKTGVISRNTPLPQASDVLDTIVGQTIAKRALAIAAAGGHNILLTGPPGTGKSLLAKSLSQLMPPLSHQEMLEVTHVSSLAEPQYIKLVTRRPIRSPHHTATPAAMVGSTARPGEIGLSHHGVLLLDELPEFTRLTLQTLRQPLENREIQITTSRSSTTYPARFVLAATANPCPCGYAGSSAKPCLCNAAQLQRYRSRLFGPIFDRIDLCCTVTKVPHESLLSIRPRPTGEEYPQQIARARQSQLQRYQSQAILNSDMSVRMLREHAQLSVNGQKILDTAADSLSLSTRGYLKVIKVARTIADMEGSLAIEAGHLSEALRYRQEAAPTQV